jgi:hypothetical protein
MKTNKNLGQRTYLLKNFSAPSKTWLFLFDFFFLVKEEGGVFLR